jgi:hypothetical protein
MVIITIKNDDKGTFFIDEIFPTLNEADVSASQGCGTGSGPVGYAYIQEGCGGTSGGCGNGSAGE